MTLRERIPDDALEMTHAELKESDEVDWEDETTTEEEFREEVGEVHEAFEVYAGAILINKMFDDGFLTLGEYLELIEYVEEYERDLDATLL
jgi:uncharacterized protein Yka (UPF0111/DUF47 family)